MSSIDTHILHLRLPPILDHGTASFTGLSQVLIVAYMLRGAGYPKLSACRDGL